MSPVGPMGWCAGNATPGGKPLKDRNRRPGFPVFSNLGPGPPGHVMMPLQRHDGRYGPYFAGRSTHREGVASSGGGSGRPGRPRQPAVVLYRKNEKKQACLRRGCGAADLAGIPPGTRRKARKLSEDCQAGPSRSWPCGARMAASGGGHPLLHAPTNQGPGQWASQKPGGEPDFSPLAPPPHISAHPTPSSPWTVVSVRLRLRPPPLDEPRCTRKSFKMGPRHGAAGKQQPSALPTRPQVAFFSGRGCAHELPGLETACGAKGYGHRPRGLNLEQKPTPASRPDQTAGANGLGASVHGKYHYALWRPITAIRDPRSR